MYPARFVALLLSTFLVASCVSTNPATGGKNFTLVNEKQEYTVGQQTAEAHIKQFGLYKDKPALTRYMEDMANRMWGETERAEAPMQLVLLDAEIFNAFATPGYIAFYRGILPFFQNETQLAEVMGHEMGHITARHTAQSMTRSTVAGLLVTAAAIYVGARSNNDAAASAAYGVGALGAGLTLNAYSRAQELEADRLALRYMERGGYEPREAYNSHTGFELYEEYTRQRYMAFNKGKQPPSGGLSALMRTHPETPDRARQVADLVGLPDGTVRLPEGTPPATPATDPFGRNRYLDMIDGLAYGPKPAYGIEGKNVVYFPKQQFVWRLPHSDQGHFLLDYTLADKGDNPTDLTWVAVNPAADIDAGISFVEMADGLSPVQTLVKHVKGVSINSSWSKLEVGSGATAQTGWTTTTDAGRTNRAGQALAMRVVGVPIPQKNLLAVIRYVYPVGDTNGTDDAMRAAVQLGGVLSEAQARALRPVQVRVRAAAAGDTVQKLAAQMAAGGLSEELFRALNALPHGTDRLALGTRYKTLVDPNL